MSNLFDAIELFRRTLANYTGYKFYYGTTDGVIKFPAGFVQHISSDAQSLPMIENDANGNEIVSTTYETMVQVTFVTKQGRSIREKTDNRSLAYRTVSGLSSAWANEEFKSFWESERVKDYPNLSCGILRTGNLRDVSDFAFERGSGTYNTLQIDFYLSIIDTVKKSIPCFTERTAPTFDVRISVNTENGGDSGGDNGEDDMGLSRE